MNAVVVAVVCVTRLAIRSRGHSKHFLVPPTSSSPLTFLFSLLAGYEMMGYCLLNRSTYFYCLSLDYL